MKLDSGDVEIPASSVSVYEAIFRRRNVKELTGEAVPPRDAGAAVLRGDLGSQSSAYGAYAVLCG